MPAGKPQTLNLGEIFGEILVIFIGSVGSAHRQEIIPQMDTETISGLSYKSIFNSICGELGDAREISRKFSELRTDEDRFKLTNDICRDFISKLNFKRINKSYEKFARLSKVERSDFSKNQDWEVFKSRNEGIAFAPADSEHLALAFYKRSIVLDGLSYPKEAEEDCSRALPLVKTDSLKINIENHKKNLVKGDKLKNGWMIGSGVISPFGGTKSTFFDSASKSVGLSHDEQWGRKLIAEEDVKTGEVLIAEKPYSSVLLPTHLYTHCTHCYKRSLNLIPCSGCSFALFCSEDCQRESQDSYHSIECKILDILVSLKLERMELLSLRILIFASQQGKNLENLYKETKKLADVKDISENCQFYKSSDFMNIYNLVTNTEKRTVSDLFYRSVISTILIFLLEKYTTFFSPVEKVESKEVLKAFAGGLILRFLQILPCNAHEVSEFSEEGFDEIGAGAYATLSLINHSCDPNVVRYCCGDVIVLRAIKPIKKGDQILDNYGYHYAAHSLKERQTALMKQYYFHCKCEPCTQLWPTYEHLPSKNLKQKKQTNMNLYKKKTEKFEENLGEIFGGKFTPEMIEENMKYLDFLDEFVVLPWQDYNKCQEAIKHCLSFSGNHFRFSKGVSSWI